jgi:PAS domain S-box-containing protein
MQPVPEGIAIFSEDITLARKNEEQRAELEAYFRGIFEHSPDCIIVADEQRRIVMINPAANQMFGYPQGALIGKAIEDLMPDASREDSSRERLELIRGADVQAVGQLWQFQARRIDGSSFPLEIRRSAFATPSGVFVLGVGRDLTERNRTEQARALLASIVENSEDAIIGKDLGSVITSWNKGAQAIFGYPAREVIGQSILKLVPEDRLQEEFGILQHIRRGQSVEHFETVRKTRDGRLIDVSISISPIKDAEGAIIGSSKIARDITRTKVLETQLRESQKMEAIGTLASGIAHDFNNILGTVMGNVELARQDAGDNRQVQESLGEIRKASVRARDLVNQILTFGRRQATSRMHLALLPAIEESARLLRATLPPRIQVRFDCADGTPDVMADSTQIQQVLLNLGSNAAHAIQGHAGLIGISMCPVELDQAAAQLVGVSAAGTYARITVSDNGHGIDAATMQRIFDPFFTTKPKGEGTGLGLSVVRNIMRDHEGCIQVFSEPGHGTRFELHFPAAGRTGLVPAQADKVAAEAAPGLRVMYIDDDESVRFVVTRMLAKRGYLVQGYPDALQGLTALRADGSAFDLIVSDVNMPGMSGLELAVIVHAERPDVPLALASGYVTDELRTQAAAAGVQEIIFKAHVADDFCDALQRLARRVARC